MVVYVHMYVYMSIYLFIFIYELIVRVSANDPGHLGSILGRVMPKTQKNGT